MHRAIKISLFSLLALSSVGCDEKSSKKQTRAELVSPAPPSGPVSGVNPTKCPISVAFHPQKGYLTNLFKATQYDHPDVKRSLGLKERLALLEQCKEERKTIKQNSAG